MLNGYKELLNKGGKGGGKKRGS